MSTGPGPRIGHHPQEVNRAHTLLEFATETKEAYPKLSKSTAHESEQMTSEWLSSFGTHLSQYQTRPWRTPGNFFFSLNKIGFFLRCIPLSCRKDRRQPSWNSSTQNLANASSSYSGAPTQRHECLKGKNPMGRKFNSSPRRPGATSRQCRACERAMPQGNAMCLHHKGGNAKAKT